MAKPNYQFEKRQRELAKKAKKAEKAARKASGRPDDEDAPADGGAVQGPPDGEAPGDPAAPASGQG